MITLSRMPPPSGIRRISAWKDLSAVSDLIEEAFAGDLDRSGYAALRELRTMSRLGPIFWAVEQFSPEFNDILSGFVWTEEGCIIGNITVNRASPGSNRWIISNVAVAHGYRNRGIATALMNKAINYVISQHGSQILLQVRHDNSPARHIYEGMGFVELWGTAYLHIDQIPKVKAQAPADMQLLSQKPDAHNALLCYDLARTALPIEQQLINPLRVNQYSFSNTIGFTNFLRRLLGVGEIKRWAAKAGSVYIATLYLQPSLWNGEHKLRFMVHPEWRGKLERELISMVLAYLYQWRNTPLLVQHQADHPEAINALKYFGFIEERTLVWMRKELK
jgi:ribosomal protein S18 acetylase RimI-like enzyme